MKIFKKKNDILNYQRRRTRVVYVGDVGVGGDNPIRVQSMTVADTRDTRATVDEIERLVAVGCEIVRVTVPSIREAENLKNIKAEMRRRGIKVPLVADIHYTPNAALNAADYVEKVRINPGNYADKKKFEQKEYSEEEYQAALQRIEERFKPLVLKCKALGRAMRIGVNHGSLSDRIMNRFGDTPEGMVESALEFVRICQKYDYHDIILSMKASNPQVAIQAYRLLVARMDELGMDYPIHLGVTEAGDGEEGRIKSAVGIGTLLEEGIGDTVRVSLTEPSENEVPVAFQLVKKYNALLENKKSSSLPIRIKASSDNLKLPDPFTYSRRHTLICDQIYHKLGNGEIPRVELSLSADIFNMDECLQEIARMLNQSEGPLTILKFRNGFQEFRCETIHIKVEHKEQLPALQNLKNALIKKGWIVSLAVEFSSEPDLLEELSQVADRLVYSPSLHSQEIDLAKIVRSAKFFARPIEWKIKREELEERDDARCILNLDIMDNLLEQIIQACAKHDYWNLLFSLHEDFGNDIIRPYRYLVGRLDAMGAPFPVLLRYHSVAPFEEVLLDAATQLGSLLCDGIGDSIHIVASASPNDLLRLSYNILQATRTRISKTEYISCPSCGRTLFDLQTTTERIKSKTSHLKGVKIAIMGCIVNGPGEMADADFGYVGAGPRKVNLFVGKECVERNIPEEMADDKLIELIKAHGKWVEP